MITYIEFENAISKFRKSDRENVSDVKSDHSEHGFFLLSDFEIYVKYKVDDCIIEKSERVFIGNNTYSNVSKLEMPNWLTHEHDMACYGTILSSIISISTERNVKFCWNYFNTEELVAVAAQLPLKLAGPGAIDKPNKEKVETFLKNVSSFIHIIHQLDYSNYINLIRSSRLFQLAKSTIIDDHNLSYSLMVASIETNATKGFKIEEIEKIKKLKEDWNELKTKIKHVANEVELPSEFRQILDTKLEQHYLADRFQEFLKKYASIGELNLDNRYKKSGLLPDEIAVFEPHDRQRDPLNYFIHDIKENNHFEDIFKGVAGLDFWKLVKNSYNYRSKFFHEGLGPKNSTVNNDDRYIKFIWDKEEKPKVSMEDFNHIDLDGRALMNRLQEDGYIKKIGKNHYCFVVSMINDIPKEYSQNNGMNIKQVFHKKRKKQIPIVSFNLLSQLCRISTFNYYASLI